jgi:hypothetical protein
MSEEPPRSRGRPPKDLVRWIVKHNHGAPAASISVIATHTNYDGAQVDGVLVEFVEEGAFTEQDGK